MPESSTPLNAVRENSQTVRGVARRSPALARLLGCVLLPTWAAACAGAPLPCRSSVACASASECLANRCVPIGAEPVAPGSTRLVLEPLAAAVVRDHGPPGDLPASVTFGGSRSQREQLLLLFPATWAELKVDAAFLLLPPALDADPTGPDIEVDVSLAAAEWSPGALSRAPRDTGPRSRGLARTRPPALLRIDVSAQLRALAEAGARDWGFVVAAVTESDRERGATYLTGADGDAPRLEVYGSPARTTR